MANKNTTHINYWSSSYSGESLHACNTLGIAKFCTDNMALNLQG